MPKLKLDIDTLTPEELEKWVEQETKKVIENLPTLKRELSLTDDRSNEFYNLEVDDITLMSRIYRSEIRQGIKSTGQTNFLKNLEKYGSTPIDELAQDYATERMEDFIESHKAYSTGEEDDEYFQELLDMMTPEDKLGFTRSKYFVSWVEGGSDQLVQFGEDFEYSLHTMKLELYMESKGYTTRGVYKDKSPSIKDSDIKSTRTSQKHYTPK